MDWISKDDAMALFEHRRKRRAIQMADICFRMTLIHPEAVYSLIFDSSSESRILCPNHCLGLLHRSYTLKEIVTMMLSRSLTFEELAEAKIAGEYKPGWFRRFEPLMQDFDFGKITPLLLMMANNQKRRHSPMGSFHIIDGRHRSLAYSYLSLSGRLSEFKPFEAILVLPVV